MGIGVRALFVCVWVCARAQLNHIATADFLLLRLLQFNLSVFADCVVQTCFGVKGEGSGSSSSPSALPEPTAAGQ